MRDVTRLARWIALVTVCGCEVKVSVDDDEKPMGTFTCTAIKDDACVEPTGRFARTVEVVHMVYRTKGLPKQGDVYVIRWVAEDVGQAAAPNTVIASLEEKVTDNPALATSYNVNSNLSKPTNGWPVGAYRVEVERGGKLETTARFKIDP